MPIPIRCTNEMRSLAVVRVPLADPKDKGARWYLRSKANQYQLDEEGVTVDEQTLFRATVQLPASLIEGDYNTRIFLTRGGSVVAQYGTLIDVRKVGLERWLYNLSRENALLYGLMSLAIAIAAGWGASAIFSALRR